MNDPYEVPERDVEHGYVIDDYAWGEGISATGTASTLEMTTAEKAKAKKRTKLQFGFGNHE